MDDEAVMKCENPNCENYKLEFVIPTRLDKHEREFADNVIWRGEREGKWFVWRIEAGGSMHERMIFGADFIVTNWMTGVTIVIEHKEQEGLNFTPDQRLRFMVERDNSVRVVRLCAILLSSSKLKKNKLPNRLLYWSPSFYQILPDDVWENNYKTGETFPPELYKTLKEGNLRRLKLSGIQGSIQQNRENTYFELVRGEFGDVQAEYKSFSYKFAYNWLYEKLLRTMENPFEEINKNYVKCQRNGYFRDEVREFLLSYLMQSYRPLHPEDFWFAGFQKFPEHFKKVKKLRNDFISEVKVVDDTTISEYVLRRMLELQRAGYDIAPIEIEGCKEKAWGIGKNKENYIPLNRSASHLLDLFKKHWQNTGKKEFELQEVEGLFSPDREYRFKTNVRLELKKAGLIEEQKIQRGKKRLTVIGLTQKCINYYTMMNVKNSNLHGL